MGVKRISLKVSDSTYKLWKAHADAQGLSLTKMLVAAVIYDVACPKPQIGKSETTVEPFRSVTIAQAKAEFAKQREDGPSVKMPEVKPLTKAVPPVEGVKKASDLPPMPKLPPYRPGPAPKKGGK